MNHEIDVRGGIFVYDHRIQMESLASISRFLVSLTGLITTNIWLEL